MGIINLTPDSFYDGRKSKNHAEILKRAEKMIEEGAAILDLGAVSTRPGASYVETDEELRRLLPFLKLLRSTFPEIFISVDTYRSEIALAASESGADIINDVYAGNFDGSMINVIAKLKIPYIIMHMQGEPGNMQTDPQYKNVVKEVTAFFAEKIKALQKKKIKQVIIDPGFGFGKKLEHNFLLLKNLEKLNKLGYPMLAGVSRKSMINKVLKTSPKNALNGTTALNTIAVLNGAKILRVHDVKEAVEAIKLSEFYKSI
ncbi:MAG: dihydropteroate synthase [Bacteroidia bacterium]|nr:dihydropteroate synthase [Bacteroidia bacterium]